MLTDDLKLRKCCILCGLNLLKNKRYQNNFAYEIANFYGSQIKGFYSKVCLLYTSDAADE